MKTLDYYRDLIETAIKDLKFPQTKVENLYHPIEYALQAGGKRIRPLLTLISADAFGEKSGEALTAATGIEIFHNFTLLHDDVMDKSDMRRGRPTVHKKFGENSAILSGDTMLTIATQLVTKVPDNVLRRVIDTFNKMAIDVYEGQQLDMDFETMSQISIDDYLEMIGKKTGALLGASAKIGAIIGGAEEREADLMYDFGYQTGIAFQIQDDWLDTFGDASTFGKAIGSDIVNGKKTYLYVLASRKSGEVSKALTDAYQITSDEIKIKTVTTLYKKLGIDEEAKKAVNHYSSLALKAIQSTGLSIEYKELLKKMAEKLIGRRR